VSARPSRAGVRLGPEAWALLERSYGEAGRAYHVWSHVEEVLRRYDEVARQVGWRHPAEVFLAVLYHDVVYVPGASDNEARSAEVCRAALEAGLLAGAVERALVARLIGLTAGHGHLDPAQLSADEALFLDCDLAILGGTPEAFAAYDAGIEQEFRALPRELYRAGRGAFFERALAAPALFLSPHFHARLEAPARRNLRGWLEQARTAG